MAGRLVGRRAIVTGGASGIGLAIAERFAAEGAAIALLDIDGPACEAATRGLVEGGTGVLCHVGNAAEPAVVERLAERLAEAGGVNVLVNAAAPSTSLDEGGDWETWRRGIEEALSSAYLVSRRLRSLLVADATSEAGGSRGASIVNISSGAAYGATRFPWYGAAKAGLLSLTRSLAWELGPAGVRANAIVPGTIWTPRSIGLRDLPERLAAMEASIPLGRVGEASEVADAALFFADPAASGYISGAELLVDGGRNVAGTIPVGSERLG
ncbi:MAG: SDR family oxidoreductase [Chloroflexi bacterium]|nr:SDR family oxidoreductase [Chloroflexota bacterium]